jgi:hypothetical protein
VSHLNRRLTPMKPNIGVWSDEWNSVFLDPKQWELKRDFLFSGFMRMVSVEKIIFVLMLLSVFFAMFS